jgi:hypothetical protein
MVNSSILRVTLDVVVSNVENVLGVTCGRYDKHVICFCDAFYFQTSLIATWI